MTLADRFTGVLFFPVTPFTERGDVAGGVLRDHVAERVADGAGAVFAACGTGEFPALSSSERVHVVRASVEAVAGRVPVLAGVGGAYGDAVESMKAAEDAGADGVLLLPPYLVSGTQDGLRRWVEGIVGAADLPVILYNRATARYDAPTVLALAADERVIGLKDGHGDLAAMQEIVAAVSADRPDFAFFNGLLTAELTQSAYRAIGVPLYSSAVFAMAPRVATAFFEAYAAHDEDARLRILRDFYLPFARLRDETPGFGVSLIKAGLRLAGVDVGPVRPPLVDPDARQTARLAELVQVAAAIAVP